MDITIRKLEMTVEQKVPADLINELLLFLKNHEPHLWGTLKPFDLQRKSLYIALYKDLNNIGFGKLEKAVKKFLPLGHNSLGHNQKVIRRILGEWATEVITPGTEEEWNTIRDEMEIPKRVSKTNMVVDSCDFVIKAKTRVHKKNANYSFKEGMYAQRFNCFFDLLGRCRYLSVGYSPKTHDKTFIKINKHWIEENLKGAVIAADYHYSWGARNFQHVKFLIKRPATITAWNTETEEEEKHCTVEDEAFNKDHSDIRSRVEEPFAQIKNTFKALSEPFQESKGQHNLLVAYAMAIHNWKTTEKYRVYGRV